MPAPAGGGPIPVLRIRAIYDARLKANCSGWLGGSYVQFSLITHYYNELVSSLVTHYICIANEQGCYNIILIF